MSTVYSLVAAGLFGCAVYLILSRNIMRVVLGLSLMTTAVNFMLLLTGRLGSTLPPLITEGTERLGESADPLPQALILTAIVIGMALTVMTAILALRAYRGEGTLSSAEINSAELLGDPFAVQRAGDDDDA